MIKKILCPTDFSKASMNGIEYASELSKTLGAGISLVNIQKVSINEGVSLFSGGERESLKSAKTSEAVMDDYCSEITNTFGITCSHLIIPTMNSIEEAIAEEGSNYDLIVTGTNGADKLYDFYFGTKSYHIAKKVAVPVLIIPDGCSYKPFNEIIFASDYTAGEQLLLKQMKAFIDNFNSHLSVIHISESDSELSREVFRSFKSHAEDELELDDRMSFHRVVNDNIAAEIENILDRPDVDLIAVCFQKHNLFYKLLHKNLIKEMTSFTRIPLLILH